jgi:hypothetical protein
MIQSNRFQEAKATISPTRMSTVNNQIRPRHKATGIREQKYDRTPVFISKGKTIHHIICRPFRFSVWVL